MSFSIYRLGMTGIGIVSTLGMLKIIPNYWPSPQTIAFASRSISGCKATDGDTIRCGEERIRLIGIDAPEMPGHCAPGRNCALGDPFASRDSLSAAMTGKMRIWRSGQDRYGRTLALITSDKGDLSCWQLQNHQATYRPDWDQGRLAGLCQDVLAGARTND